MVDYKSNEIILKKIFSLLVVLFPIFYRYRLFIPIVTLSEIILFAYYIIWLLSKKYTLQIVRELLPFIVYLTAHFFLLSFRIIKTDNYTDAVGTLLRLLFLYFSIFLFARSFFCLEYAKKWLIITANILSLYGLLQLICSSQNVFLSTYLPFMGRFCTEQDLDTVIANRVILYNLKYRFSSFLREPAHLCTYLILAQYVVLFTDNPKRIDICEAFLYFLVCILSLSSTGLILSSLIWVLYVIKIFKDYYIQKQIIINSIIIIVIAVILGLYINEKFGFVSYFIQRTIGNKGLSENTRFYGITSLNIQLNTIIGFLFGNGMSGSEIYLPGFPRLILNLGVVGFLTVLYSLITVYFNTDVYFGKEIVLLYIILNIGTEVLLGNYAFLYLPFIYCSKNNGDLDRR